MLGRLTEEDIINSNVREIEDFIADCSSNVIAEKLLEYIMLHYLKKSDDVRNDAKLEPNQTLVLMILAISKVDKDIFRDVVSLLHALRDYDMPFSIFFLEAIEKVYWSDNIVVVFDKCMKYYPVGIIFKMLHKATKSSLTSTKKMVHDIFMRDIAHYLCHDEICKFSAQLENIKWLAETEQYVQAKDDYRELTCNYGNSKQ